MGTEFLLTVLLFAALLAWLRLSAAGRGRHRIRVEGEWRTYSIHRPRRDGSARATPAKHPLLLCFHGGLGRVERIRDQSGIKEAALERGFTVVFPEAPDGWVDARPEKGGGTRDLVFVDALLDRLQRSERGPVYALGVSNGGMFVYRLAMEQPSRFAGFAALLASIPAAALKTRPLGVAVPMALVFGREDHIMPYVGGRIASRRGMGVGGMVISAEATLEYWLRYNRARREPRLRRTGGAGLPVLIRDYAAAPPAAPVRYVEIEGWGHRWPRWPDEGEGAFDIADVIFEFFAGLSDAAPATEAEPVRVQLGGTR